MHESQHDGNRLAHVGQEAEEAHQRPAPREYPARLVELLFAHAQTLNPFAAPQRTNPVAAHAAQRVAHRRGGQTPERVEPHPHEDDEHRFGAEGQDASGDEG